MLAVLSGSVPDKYQHYSNFKERMESTMANLYLFRFSKTPSLISATAVKLLFLTLSRLNCHYYHVFIQLTTLI
jgi:hypothetical protein